MTDPIKAPWSEQQVCALWDFQNAGYVHPFTCPHHSQEGMLIPTVRGWVCQFCDYTQDWTHAQMFRPVPSETILSMIEESRIERMARAMAHAEMVMTLEASGVMAISPEKLEAIFKDAWEGTTDHDERCRQRFRTLAKAAYGVVSQ